MVERWLGPASSLTMIIGLVAASLAVSVSVSDGLVGLELSLLGLAPVIAVTAFERRGLWLTTAAAGITLIVAATLDLREATSSTDTLLRTTVALVALLGIAWLLERTVLREREALTLAQRKLADLERAQQRQLEDEQQRANVERALAQAQRFESLGQLAGSVAHDFNNLLVGIHGNIELATQLDDRDEARALLGTANELVLRAAVLTRNLLRFAKGAPTDAELVDIHALLHGCEAIYASLVGKSVSLRVELGATRSTIAFNPARFEQLLLNLVVNASDAMPNGGQLCIGTRDRDDERLELCVSDTGQGMSESIQVMIFQPFFTTKRNGTGIGLATVQDIVAAAGGEIRVESAVGQGTRFCVVLPLQRD